MPLLLVLLCEMQKMQEDDHSQHVFVIKEEINQTLEEECSERKIRINFKYIARLNRNVSTLNVTRFQRTARKFA